MRRVARQSGAHRGARVRRVRQRWRWVPLAVRLRFAQIRNRWMHRRGLRRALFVAVCTVAVVVMVNWDSAASRHDAAVVSVPEGHRVVSVPKNDRVPPLVVGDEVDFYLAPVLGGGFERSEAGVDVLTEPGIVVMIEDDALAVAVPEAVVVPLVSSVANDAVLLVRR